MPDSFSCWVTPNSAGDEVRNQFEILRDYADVSFDKAMSLTDELVSFVVPNLSFHADLMEFSGFPISDPTGLVPELEEAEFGIISAPPPPTITMPGAMGNPGPVPDRPADAPPPVFGPAPDVYEPTFGLAPTVVMPEVPEYGDFAPDIPVPDMFPITLPDVPVIDLASITFVSTRPTFTDPPPDAGEFDYVAEDYTPLVMAEVKQKVLDMLNGASGIPAVIENAIFARETERDDETAFQIEQAIREDWASRGFKRPSGPLDKLLSQARQKTRDNRSAKSRETAIRIQDVLLEQLKTAMATGISMEDLWTRLYTTIQDRRLQAAQVTVNLAIAVFNAKVALFNAEMQAYQVDAEVYKTRIEAELGKLQVYSESIKAQALIGTLNQQLIDIYSKRLEAVNTNVRIFAALIDAYSAQINGEKLKLEVYKTTLEAESTKLQASSIEAQIYGQTIQAENIKQQTAATRVQAYLANVQAYSAQYQAIISRFTAEISRVEAEARVYDSQIRGVEAQLGVTRARVEEVTSRNQARIQGFVANTQAASTVNSAQAQLAEAKNSTNKANADIAIKNAEVNAENALRAKNILLEALQAASRVLTGVVSGAMAAGNVSAQIGDSTSATSQCTYSTTQHIG